MRRMRMRIHWASAVVLVIALLLAAVPADACGCGGYVPREGDARVAEERALIRWDGRTEEIVMELRVAGRSREAAWFLPVPSRATVQLGDRRLFDALQELTKPLVRVERVRPEDALTGSAPPPSSVSVLKRQSLGPFDVTTLTASDASALGDWLQENGYKLPEGLETAVQPYVEQHWYYIAVRLRPGRGTKALTGRLDPLWVTFPSDKIIYPMRLTSLAEAVADPEAVGFLPVYLYVLADHRVEPPPSFKSGGDPESAAYQGDLSVKYADWVEPRSLQPDSPLAPFVSRKLFLTKFYLEIYQPRNVRDDFVFPFAKADESYRDVEIRQIVDPNAGPSLPLPASADGRTLAIVLAALAATVGGILLWRRRLSS